MKPCWFFLFLPVVLFSQSAYQVSGRVVLDGLVKGIPDLVISATPLKTTSPGLAEAVQTVSDKDGAFNLTLQQPGIYKLCAQSPESNYVNDCMWGYRNVDLDLTSTKKFEGVLIAVRRGVPVEVQIDDPNKKLQEFKKAGNSGVNIGVMTKGGLFHNMWQQSERNNGRKYRLVIPFDTDVSIYVRSRSLTLRDNNGRAYGQSERLPFRRNTEEGDSTHQINIKVD